MTSRNCVYRIARLTMTIMWLYLAIFPKYVFTENVQVEVVRAWGLFPGNELNMLRLLGVCEIGLAAAHLLLWTRREVFLVNIALLIGLNIISLLAMPAAFAQPFNPLTIGLPMMALSLAGYASGQEGPLVRWGR